MPCLCHSSESFTRMVIHVKSALHISQSSTTIPFRAWSPLFGQWTNWKSPSTILSEQWVKSSLKFYSFYIESVTAFYRLLFTWCIQGSHCNFVASDLILAFNELFQKDTQKFLSLVSASEDTPLTPELAVLMKQIWSDTGVKECFKRSRDYQLNDSAE